MAVGSQHTAQCGLYPPYLHLESDTDKPDSVDSVSSAPEEEIKSEGQTYLQEIKHHRPLLRPRLSVLPVFLLLSWDRTGANVELQIPEAGVRLVLQFGKCVRSINLLSYPNILILGGLIEYGGDSPCHLPFFEW